MKIDEQRNKDTRLSKFIRESNIFQILNTLSVGCLVGSLANVYHCVNLPVKKRKKR